MTWPTIRRRRKKTAKQTAEALGISVRTVRRHLAESREDYENRASQRKEKAGQMRAEGATWAEIAKAIEGTEWAARSLVRRYRVEQETPEVAAPRSRCR